MPRREFLVTFKSGDEQLYVAEEVAEADDHLVFLNPSDPNDGLAGLASLTDIKEWREVEREQP